MKPNQIVKIKTKNKDYILSINNQEYIIDEFLYTDLFPYEGKQLEVSQMHEVIAFSNAHDILKRNFKKIFANKISTYDFKSKLKNVDIDDFDINIIINKLKSFKYLDDEAFARYYLYIYQEKKGKKAFKTFLIQKKINSKIIDKVLLDYQEDIDVAYERAYKMLKNNKSSKAIAKP